MTKFKETEQKHHSAEAQLSSLKQVHSRQSNQLHTVQADLTVTSSELARAQTAHASAKAAQQELEHQNHDLLNVKTDLEQQLHAEKQAVVELHLTRQTLEDDLHRTREEAEAESKASSEQARQMGEDQNAIQVKLTAAESEVQELLRQVDQLKAANLTLTEKERAYQAYKLEAEADRASFEQQMAELRELQQMTATESAETKTQLETLEANHTALLQQQSPDRVQTALLPRALGIADAFARHAQDATSLLVDSMPSLSTNAAASLVEPSLGRIAPVPSDSALTEEEIESQLQKIEGLTRDVAESFPQAIIDHLKASKSTLLRWQKECKAYRHRDRSKIAFHNFKEGDLALFLPTRNITAQIWAAFESVFHFPSALIC